MLPGLAQVVEQLADVLVLRLHHRRVGRHHARLAALLLFAEIGPGPQQATILIRREGRVSGNDAVRLLGLEPGALKPFETDLEVVLEVAVDQIVRSLQRRVGSGVGQIGEEGLPAVAALFEVLQHLGREEVIGVDALGSLDFFAVLVERFLRDLSGLDLCGNLRVAHVDVKNALVPVVGTAGVDPVASVEAPFVGSFSPMAGSAEVPLADHVGAIAGIPQQLRNGGGRGRQVGLVAGLALCGWVDGIVEGGQPDIDGVVAGQQHGAGHGADRRGMKAGEGQAVFRQALERRRVGHGPADAEVAEADVVTDDQQNVRPLRGVCGHG